MSATLRGQARQESGSRHARLLRRQGRIPVTIQGEGKENLSLAILEDEFLSARRHHEHLFDIQVDGGTETAMVRDLQWDPLGERILHVDFRRVIRGQKTEAEVELEFSGHPKGGVLNHLLTHVPIRALPTEIPDKIEVRVDELEPGHPIFARDLELPEGVELTLEPDTQIAVVTTVRATEELEEAPEEGVEVEGEAAPEDEEKPEGEAEPEEE